MRNDDGLSAVLSDGFTRYLDVTVLHGTDVVASGVRVESWSLDGALDNETKTSGRLRIVHESLNGESWVPDGRNGVLSPFRATLLLTEVITAGSFERRVQLGLFDVQAVPRAQDVTATINARWVQTSTTSGDEIDDLFTDVFTGFTTVTGGRMVGGQQIVVASIVDVDVVSLDNRVVTASFRSPRTNLASAWDEWRQVGILPVVSSTADVSISRVPWPAERGSRIEDVQECARKLGGVGVVDSFGQWVLVTDQAPTVTLQMGEFGTVVDYESAITLDDFANVIIGTYETDDGEEIREEWVAPGAFSPTAMRREIVRYHSSPLVKTRSAARATVASLGAAMLRREVDVEVTCVYNPLIELGDRVTVPGVVSGVARAISVSDEPVMRVIVREVRAL